MHSSCTCLGTMIFLDVLECMSYCLELKSLATTFHLLPMNFDTGVYEVGTTVENFSLFCSADRM